MAVVRALAGIFVELLFAPTYEPGALDELQRTKKKCRVFEVPCDRRALAPGLPGYPSVLGGLPPPSTDQLGPASRALQLLSPRAAGGAAVRGPRFLRRRAQHPPH